MKLRHRLLRPCDRHPPRLLLEHVLPQAAALAFEAQAPTDFTSPHGPQSPPRECALHRATSALTQCSYARTPRPMLPHLRPKLTCPLPYQPIDVERSFHNSPTCCVYHEDRAMQAACARGNPSQKTQPCTPVQADACGSEPEPPDQPMQAERYSAYTRIWRALSRSRSRL